MTHYSPFAKPIDDLRADDLKALQDIDEGWHVEYKSGPIGARALAKSLAAFANTYGGWLFVGVQEPDTDQDTTFPGVSTAEVEGVLHRLRNSAAANVNPVPFFRTTVLAGPCAAIALSDGCAVIAVEILRSNSAPHVHRDGRIYVRVADGSEVVENDRFILDQLWHRGEPSRARVRKWIERDPAFDDVEEQTPYVRLLMCVDPWQQNSPHLGMTLPELQRTLSAESKVPFDVFFPTSDGFIVRQVGSNAPHRHGLLWRIRRDLSADLLVPLSIYESHGLAGVMKRLDGYRYRREFAALLQRDRHNNPRIADLNFLFVVLRGIILHYRRLLASVGCEKSFFVKTRVLHTARMVPFVDVNAVVNQFTQSGMPIVFDEAVTVPPGSGIETFREVRDLEEVSDEHARDMQEEVACVFQAFIVFMMIAESLGISPFSENSDVRGDPSLSRELLEEILEVAERAVEAQARREGEAGRE